MQAEDFKRWRKGLKLSQKEAAEALGLKRRVVQYYEKGERDGEQVQIPKYVRLACYAIAQDVHDYSGPSPEQAKAARKARKEAARNDAAARAAAGATHRAAVDGAAGV